MRESVASRHASYPGFRATLKLVGTGPRGSRDLSFEEAREAMRALLVGEVSPAQAGAFLIAARIKGESPAELAGYAQALRDACIDLSPRVGGTDSRAVVCSAGAYDGSVDVPALSLAAGVAAAACGVGVAIAFGPGVGPKHGVTPGDVLVELGGPALVSAAESEAMMARAGVALVDASQVVSGWAELLGVRDEIGLRGPVHSAEKLLNHFGAGAFVVGYTHAAYSDRLLSALGLLRAEASVAVRGIEGSDVVRPGRPVAHRVDGRLELPERLGATALPADAAGAAGSAALTRAVLGGEERGAARAAVVLSAAIRLYAAGLVRDARDGIDLADAAVSDGRAVATLDALIGR